MERYLSMWNSLDIDIDLHTKLLEALSEYFKDVYLTQKNSPQKMNYFYKFITEIHGGRIEEILREREKGRVVVGTFCIFVPEEIVVGMGGVCVGLCGGAQFSIEFAEEDLPRNICPLIKSAYGFKKSRTCPYIQSSHFIYGETTCEAKKKTWEILNTLHPTFVMHIPHIKGDRELKMWSSEIVKFKEHLELVSGTKIKKDEIIKGIKIVNEKRKAMKKLEDLRKEKVVPISGLDSLLIEQVSFYDEPVRFTENLNLLCDELEDRIERGISVVDEDTPRILIAGSPMAPPNWKIHNVVEKSGGIVVGEESCIGNRYYKDNISYSEDMTEEELIWSMVERYAKVDCACFTPNNERAEKILNLAKKLNADGVIYYTLSFCHTYNIEFKKVSDLLRRNNIPVLKIESDYSIEDEGQLRTRIEAFLEGIK